MPERGMAPGCGEELRRMLARRRERRQRLRIALAGGCAVILLALPLAWKPPLLLVWNASPSSPVGLYLVRPFRAPRVGDMAVVWAPEPARAMAASRRYLPADVPLVKHVAAAAGDSVCAAGSGVSINGRGVAVRLERDRAGRAMPRWSGCRRLAPHEYFLLGESPLSFDGRYFGISRRSDLLGRARLLLARPARGSARG